MAMKAKGKGRTRRKPAVLHPPSLMPKPWQRHPKPKLEEGMKYGPGRFVMVPLTAVHRINGVAYGPGMVKVRENLSKQLLETEERMKEYNRSFLTPQGAIIQLSYGSPRVIKVPMSSFDDALEHYQSTIR